MIRSSGEKSEFSGSTLLLAQADLARSGLTLDEAQANGMFFVDDANAVHPDFARHPAIVIPYKRIDGSPLTYEHKGSAVPYARVRYLSAPASTLPKDGRRYDAPRGSGSQIYLPTRPARSVLEPGAVCIVEGEKKAAALCKVGIPCVAIGGVDSVREDKSGHALHPDLAAIVANFRDVYIVFDSDVATNANVERAEQRLATLLALQGARVHCVRLPAVGQAAAGGKSPKVGADDFIVQQGADALRSLILSTPALGERAHEQPGKTISTFDMLGRQVQPVEELIPGLVQKGIVTFLAAPGGNHKSRLAQQWAQALNVGVAPFGRAYSEASIHFDAGASRATMVHVSAEDDENELARRAQAIADVLELPPPAEPTPDNPYAGGVFLPRKGKDSALALMGENGDCTLRPFYYELIALLQRIPGHKIVVLDSAYDFVRFKGFGKIDEDSVNLFIKVVLQGVCDKADCTIIMPWHPSQAGSGRSEMDGWSVAWRNAARSRLKIEANANKEDEFILTVEKRNHAAKGRPIKLRFYRGALLPSELVPQTAQDAGALRQVVVREAIRAAELGVPFTSQRNIATHVLQLVEEELSRKLTSKMFKDELRAALDAGELQYLRGSKRQAAGYYPNDTAIANELARRAKTQPNEPAA